eukprot:NODE_4044_length_1124_cov_107.500500_g3850_i0.p1 GENE.NODE_4044_length_1124_cov_107.500500_g3850_i0~~NODE_4044_length_1124_cov_107.500500_g3850_i0.p1  ORF type:complete len:305 (+),score=47.21 NODE_4044_length_1124_cov_107.500500_g3850_i0:59-916(+)
MNWLKSWVSSPESRCRDVVQQVLERKPVSEDEWATFNADIVSDEIPGTLISGLPGLVDAVHQRDPDNHELFGHLLRGIARASITPTHAAALVKAEGVPTVWGQWRRGTPTDNIIEVLCALRNLLLWPAGGDMFIHSPQDLERALLELDRGATCANSMEARVHMLCMLANLCASCDKASMFILDRHLPVLLAKFKGNTNRLSIAVVFNILLHDKTLEKGRAAHKEQIISTLVTNLGNIVKEDCEDKSMEYKLGSRIIQLLEGGKQAGSYNPTIFPFKNENVLAVTD